MDTGSKMLSWQTFVVAETNSLQWMMKNISWARHLFWWDSSVWAPWPPWCHWEGEGILRPVGLKRYLLVLSNNLRVMEVWEPIGVEMKLSSQAACCGWVSLASLICSPRHLLAVSGPAGKARTSLGLLYLVGFPVDSLLLMVSEEFPFDSGEECAYLGCLVARLRVEKYWVWSTFCRCGSCVRVDIICCSFSSENTN